MTLDTPKPRFLALFCRKGRHCSAKNGRISASDAGWSSLAARRAHNPKVVGSNPAPATKYQTLSLQNARVFC